MCVCVCVRACVRAYRQASDMWEVNGVATKVLKYLAPLKSPLDVKEVSKCMQNSLYIRLTHLKSPSCTPASVCLLNVGPVYINPFHVEFFCLIYNKVVSKSVLYVCNLT
jgi:hypothetical protein